MMLRQILLVLTALVLNSARVVPSFKQGELKLMGLNDLEQECQNGNYQQQCQECGIAYLAYLTTVGDDGVTACNLQNVVNAFNDLDTLDDEVQIFCGNSCPDALLTNAEGLIDACEIFVEESEKDKVMTDHQNIDAICVQGGDGRFCLRDFLETLIQLEQVNGLDDLTNDVLEDTCSECTRNYLNKMMAVGDEDLDADDLEWFDLVCLQVNDVFCFREFLDHFQTWTWEDNAIELLEYVCIVDDNTCFRQLNTLLERHLEKNEDQDLSNGLDIINDSQLCSRDDDGMFCYQRFIDLWTQSNDLSNGNGLFWDCPSTDKIEQGGAECSSECASGLEILDEEIGCCVNFVVQVLTDFQNDDQSIQNWAESVCEVPLEGICQSQRILQELKVILTFENLSYTYCLNNPQICEECLKDWFKFKTGIIPCDVGEPTSDNGDLQYEVTVCGTNPDLESYDEQLKSQQAKGDLPFTQCMAALPAEARDDIFKDMEVKSLETEFVDVSMDEEDEDDNGNPSGAVTFSLLFPCLFALLWVAYPNI